MHNQLHDAAGPLERVMSQPFVIDEEGRAFIKGSEILKSQILVSGIGLSLSPDFADKAQEKADLLERRLTRLEKELGLDPICAD